MIFSLSFLGPKIWAMVSQDIKNCESLRTYHCMKSVCIRSYSGPHFPAFELNTDTFYAVFIANIGFI